MNYDLDQENNVCGGMHGCCGRRYDDGRVDCEECKKDVEDAIEALIEEKYVRLS
jgi:hypothetical protein